ncbi:MAG: LemA family protein [Verrucomicrobiota bacterium]
MDSDTLSIALAVAGSLLCLFAAFRAGRHRWLVEHLPTSKTTGVFIGFVKLKGTAETPAPLTSYLAGEACVHYSWEVQEHYSHTYEETYVDKDGKRQTRTKTDTGWKTVDEGGQTIPFYLQDDRGVILVRPAGAQLDTMPFVRRTCGPGDPMYFGRGRSGAIAHSTHERLFVEVGVALHTPLTVLGQARERKDAVAAEIAADKEAPLFTITTRSDKKLRWDYQFGLAGWAFLGALPLAWLLALQPEFQRAISLSFSHVKFGWEWYAMGGAYAFAVMAMWVWMVFNALVDLRNRVRQGWSQVEVQLQRRQDLIPNLVNVVKGFRGHEQGLQTELADLRSQLAATPPGRAGADFHGVRRTVLTMAERYPDLKADQHFLALQRSLSETEERIALARGYFNDIASAYNTQLEVVPENLVAKLGGMRPQALLLAEDFERAPVSLTPPPPEEPATVAAT